jgi:hypothetical protein
MYKKLTLLLFCFLTFAFASAQTFTVNGIKYNVLSGTANVEVVQGSCFAGDLTLPSSVSNSGTTYSVTAIGQSAFSFCATITSITIPNSVTLIGQQGFRECTSLKSVSIPNSVTSIGDSAFFDCYSLTSVTIPNSVTSIISFTFYGCTSLTSVMIPNSVSSIGTYTFYNCTSLTSIVCDIITPLVIDTTVFSGVTQNACSLKVPAGSVSMYQSAAVWKNFNPRLPESSLGINDITSQKNILLYPNPVHNEAILEVKNSEATKLEVYDTNGKVVVRKSLNNNKNSIDTSTLPVGMYLFKTISAKSTSVTKVIKN